MSRSKSADSSPAAMVGHYHRCAVVNYVPHGLDILLAVTVAHPSPGSMPMFYA